jgi:hypothetical protein
MGLAHSPSIVIDGLRFCLDAANTKSYPGSGTTWTDISGKNHDGTLTNGPTFSSDNGGCIVFDGSNDHIGSIGTATDLGINDTSSSFSFSVWFKTGGTSEYYMFDNFDGSTQDISCRLDAGKLELYLRGSGGIINAVRYGSYTLNAWNNAVYNFDSSTSPDTFTAYVNGINTGTSTSNFSGNFESGSSFRIGMRPAGGGQFPGRIACAMLYNKSLTEAEVKQNYNALKGRFGL